MMTLNLTKDQATTAILEALNEGDEDKATDVSRFQQVQEAFPENFEQFLETNDIPFPAGPSEWGTFSNSFKEHLAGITRHVEYKIHPVRNHRLRHKANRKPKEARTSTLRQNQTFTLSMMMIAFITIKSSLVPLIEGLCAQI